MGHHQGHFAIDPRPPGLEKLTLYVQQVQERTLAQLELLGEGLDHLVAGRDVIAQRRQPVTRRYQGVIAEARGGGDGPARFHLAQRCLAQERAGRADARRVAAAPEEVVGHHQLGREVVVGTLGATGVLVAHAAQIQAEARHQRGPGAGQFLFHGRHVGHRGVDGGTVRHGHPDGVVDIGRQRLGSRQRRPDGVARALADDLEIGRLGILERALELVDRGLGQSQPRFSLVDVGLVAAARFGLELDVRHQLLVGRDVLPGQPHQFAIAIEIEVGTHGPEADLLAGIENPETRNIDARLGRPHPVAGARAVPQQLAEGQAAFAAPHEGAGLAVPSNSPGRRVVGPGITAGAAEIDGREISGSGLVDVFTGRILEGPCRHHCGMAAHRLFGGVC